MKYAIKGWPVLLLAISFTHAMQDPLATKRLANPNTDPFTHSWVFQLSLLGKDQISKILPFIFYLEGIPAISYYGDFIIERLALIELDPLSVIPRLPQSLVNEVKKNLHADVADALKAYVQITGSPWPVGNTPWDNTYWLAFHPALAAWAPHQQRNIKAKLLMGIFDADGLRELSGRYRESVSFNKLSSITVHIHPGSSPTNDAISPNNARFGILNDRAISTGWSAGLSPDKKHAVATYHIFINTPAVQKALVPVITKAQTLGDLLKGLNHAAQSLDPLDAQALKKAVALIKIMAGVKAKRSEVAEVTLQEQLRHLGNHLNSLEQRLND